MTHPYKIPPFSSDTEKAMSVLVSARGEWLDATLKRALMGLGYSIDPRADEIFSSRKRLKELRKLPVIAQRSDEWYRLRNELLTASDLAQAIGKGKFGTRNQLLAKKSGLEHLLSGGASTFNANIPHLKWGIMYEPVAQECYRKMNGGIPIYEFGLIQHPAFPIFGASPDGITALGTMLEIKCPYQRKIEEGKVPEQYHLQIQGQLEVCDLEECDYFECAFKEYGRDEVITISQEDHVYFGVVYECQGANNEPSYIYSAVYDWEPKSIRAFKKWDDEQTPENLVRKHYWTLEKTNTVRVRRDRSLFQDLKPQIEQFWAEVTEARSKGVLPFEIKPPRTRAPKAPVVEKFAFIDDEEEM